MEEAINLIIEYAGMLPSDQCEIFIALLGGEASRIPQDATAYSHRNAYFVMNVHSRWDAAGNDDICIKWAREFFRATEPYATGGVYVNFMSEDETDRVMNAFGKSYERLSKIKNKYDPENFFRVNQNIKPTT